MLTVQQTNLPEVLLIKRKISSDHRGMFAEIYRQKDYFAAGITHNFVEDNCSVSKQGVLRGLHGDVDTWKLVTCLLGNVYLVVLNYDETSPFYGQWQAFGLDAVSGEQILVPPKYGNGHLVLSEKAVFHYKRSTNYRGPQNQFVIKWNDPRFNITWPIIDNPTLSPRDS